MFQELTGAISFGKLNRQNRMSLTNVLIYSIAYRKGRDIEKQTHQDPEKYQHKCRYFCRGWDNKHPVPRSAAPQNQDNIDIRSPPEIELKFNKMVCDKCIGHTMDTFE